MMSVDSSEPTLVLDPEDAGSSSKDGLLSSWVRIERLPYVLAVLCPFVFYRDWFLDGRLPGDTGDARWTINIFEHWFRVLHLR